MEAAQASELGQLVRRALELRAAIKLGIRVGLDEIRADEFAAMLAIEEEQARWEQEKLNAGRQQA